MTNPIDPWNWYDAQFQKDQRESSADVPPTASQPPSASPKQPPADPARRPPGRIRVVMCVVLATVFWAQLGLPVDMHWPRMLSIALATGVGLLAGVVWLRKRRWHIRLAAVVLGAGTAYLCYWFVPTTRGMNFSEATAHVAALEAVQPDDIPAYMAAVTACKEVRTQFPLLTRRI
jgi:hypothetical protein